MSKKVRSAKGEMVDFELLKIKQDLLSKAEPVEVKNRQQFIENRLKRNLNKAKAVLESNAKGGMEVKKNKSNNKNDDTPIKKPKRVKRGE